MQFLDLNSPSIKKINNYLTSSYKVHYSVMPDLRLDPGFHLEPWIPALAGMTTLLETVSLWMTLFILFNQLFNGN